MSSPIARPEGTYPTPLYAVLDFLDNKLSKSDPGYGSFLPLFEDVMEVVNVTEHKNLPRFDMAKAVRDIVSHCQNNKPEVVEQVAARKAFVEKGELRSLVSNYFLAYRPCACAGISHDRPSPSDPIALPGTTNIGDRKRNIMSLAEKLVKKWTRTK
ncbi:hypothetical protein BJX70DRAFT_397043 [Aspergillus crustosus]